LGDPCAEQRNQVVRAESLFQGVVDKKRRGSVDVPAPEIVNNLLLEILLISNKLGIKKRSALKGILAYTEEPLVSCDFIDNPKATLFNDFYYLIMSSYFMPYR
jgi:hypothetical protein